MSQPEALLDEGFHGRAALVGSMAFFVAKKKFNLQKSFYLFIAMTDQ